MSKLVFVYGCAKLLHHLRINKRFTTFCSKQKVHPEDIFISDLVTVYNMTTCGYTMMVQI
jgi:dihydroxyacetone kinase